MSFTPRIRPAIIEALEDRIAPALLVKGANLLGAGGPTSGETSVGDNSVTLVKVLSGQALVWFDGFHVTAISVGPNTRLDITGDVGTIVANLEADGTLSDSDGDATNGEDGSVLLPNDILGIKTHPLSNQKGSIGVVITGGAISNVDVAGELDGLYAGDGVFRTEFNNGSGGPIVLASVGDIDIDPITAGQQTFFTIDHAWNTGADAVHPLLKAGASVTNVHVTLGKELEIYAGNGATVPNGNGIAGGSVTKITIDSAQAISGFAYHLIAGDGGEGKKGGAGGSISNIIEITSSGEVKIEAGDGGNGTGGAGGAGGSVVGLDLQSSSTIYNVYGGKGGNGTPGGAGGKLSGNNFVNRTPTTGILVSADFTGDGLDDVLVADASTGGIVIEENLGVNNGFQPIVQYIDSSSGDPVIVISSLGVTPVDAFADDVNSDGKMDFVVTYKNGVISAFLNQGSGVFWDSSLSGTGDYDRLSGNIGFTPVKVANLGGGFLGVAENTDGKGTMHFVGYAVNDDQTGLDTISTVSKLTYSTAIVDLAGSYIGLGDGTVISYSAFLSTDGVVTSSHPITPVAGGLIDLDIDAASGRLLAVSPGARTVTVYDISGSTETLLTTLSLAQVPGRPLMAKFVDDGNSSTEDDIFVLTTLNSGATFAHFTATADDGDPTTIEEPYTFVQQGSSSNQLKNFVPVNSGTGIQIAAVSGSLKNLSIITDFNQETLYLLPFGVKEIHLNAGNGGKGLDLSATKLGKGGDGGSITGLNADALLIELVAGIGGDSTAGAAGRGGSISNAGSFTTAGGATVTPTLTVTQLVMTAGDGGSPTTLTDSKAAAGGAGGSISGLTITLNDDVTGDTAPKSLQIVAGDAGIGKGGAGGAGGNVSNISVVAGNANLSVTAGEGGAALGTLLGNGGAGGSITNFKYKLTLDEVLEALENGYSLSFQAGNGKDSAGGIGGAGGNLTNVTLEIDGADRTYDDAGAKPPKVDAHRDSTVVIAGSAGEGGNGAKGGGAGGSITGFSSTTIHDQKDRFNTIILNYVVLNLSGGGGGDATVSGNGGAGGTISFSKPLSGITYWDPDSAIFVVGSPVYDPGAAALTVVAGDGGNGAAKGGAGGSVTGLTAQNAQFVGGINITQNHLESASIVAGDGGQGGSGNGGDGGAIKNLLIGVSAGFESWKMAGNFVDVDVAHGSRGFLDVLAGTGGISTSAKGGNGGAVSSAEMGLVQTDMGVGINVVTGDGGNGATAGGAGGVLGGGAGSIKINVPQSTDNLSVFLTAGDGGTASGAGAVGGKGGDVNGVLQAKDFNSSLNLIQAGSGGAAGAGKGGAGGNVSNVKTVGFIGRPSDGNSTRLGVFDHYDYDKTYDFYSPLASGTNIEFAQGVFSGRGGDGSLSDGVNGAITSIAARQVSALAAAPDLVTGLFAPASKVTGVTAAVVGYDINGDHIFATTGAAGTSPSAAKPIDGFILAGAITKVSVTPLASFPA